MTSSTSLASTAAPARPRPTDRTWLRAAIAGTAVLVPSLLLLAVVGTFSTTSGEGTFRHTADYWYTAVAVPIGVGTLLATWAIHRLQHGADGRLGTIGTALTTVAVVELMVQCGASVAAGAELRWGPSYPLAVLGAFVGLALLVAGSWRTGLLPRWQLGALPVLWVIGSFAAIGPVPLLLAVFFVAFGVTLTRRVRGGRTV